MPVDLRARTFGMRPATRRGRDAPGALCNTDALAGMDVDVARPGRFRAQTRGQEKAAQAQGAAEGRGGNPAADAPTENTAPIAAGKVPPPPAQSPQGGQTNPAPVQNTVATVPNVRLSTQLQQAGTRTCLPQIEQYAAATMQGVTGFNSAAHWLTALPTRDQSIFLGQQYGNKNVPYGVTGVFAAPTSAGTCDAMSVQVVPSPLPCDKLREGSWPPRPSR